MNTEYNPGVQRTCECGRKFRTSAKFGNETMCKACYKRHSQEFNAWLESLPDDELSRVVENMRVAAAELFAQHGKPLPPELQPASRADDEAPRTTVESVNPEQVPADDQAAIDATFAEIMASVNWEEG